MTQPPTPGRRLTSYAAGGGCACKIPAGRLEELLRPWSAPDPRLVVGFATGDDAGVRIVGDQAVVSTADFFTPVVDEARDWGRIAAANALSDVYAMGGSPIMALNLLGWPLDDLPLEIAAEVLGGAAEIADQAACPIAGGHSITAPEPVFGMAVTGIADPTRLLRHDKAAPGLPLCLSKPLGVGVLNNRHKATGEYFPQAIETMTALNAEASAAALAAGAQAATDVTGFGLLGHLDKLCRASGVSAVVDAAAVPVLDGVRDSLRRGHVPGGTRRNLEHVAARLDVGADEEALLVLADAQTSGGLLIVGEVPGLPVIGHTVASQPWSISVR